jgi:hypothetical protein
MRSLYAQYYAIHASYIIWSRMSHIPETDLRTTLTGTSMWSLTGMQTFQTHPRLLLTGLTGGNEQVSGTRYPSAFQKAHGRDTSESVADFPNHREETIHPRLTGAKHC